MAAKTPVTKGTAGYVPPGGIFLNHANATPDTLASGRLVRSEGLVHQVWYFNSIVNGNLWTTPPAGIVACAWAAGDTDSTAGSATLNANRQILFTCGGTEFGWLHTWSRGSKVRASGTNVPPSGKTVAGYTQPNTSVRYSDHAAVPDTFTSGRTGYFQGLNHKVEYFADIDINDTYTPPYPAKTRATAWQAAGTADRVMPYTLDTHVITFFGSGANANGWLHRWTR